MNLNLRKVSPLALSVFLQFAPVCKFVCQNGALVAAPMAIVFRWAAAVAAAAGAFHAVSAASTAIVGLTKYVGNTPVGGPTNNATGKVGEQFRYRITVTNAGSDHNKDYWNCIPLPPGLMINTNIGGNGFITNVPTAAGVYNVRLYAGNTSYPRPVTYDAIITIEANGSPPVITSQPVNLTVLEGQPAQFTAGATGSPSPSFQWLHEGSALAGQTNPVLSLPVTHGVDAGHYAVRVSNSAGTNTSNPAVLTVVEPPTLTVSASTPDSVRLAFMAEPTVTYYVEYGTNLPLAGWSLLTTVPPRSNAAPEEVTDSTVSASGKVYRVRLVVP